MTSLTLPTIGLASPRWKAGVHLLYYIAGVLYMSAALLAQAATPASTLGAVLLGVAAIATALTPMILGLRGNAELRRQLRDAKADRVEMRAEVALLRAELAEARAENRKITAGVAIDNRKVTASAVSELKQAITPGSGDGIVVAGKD